MTKRIEFVRRQLAHRKPKPPVVSGGEPSWDNVARLFEETTELFKQTIASFESLAETYEEMGKDEAKV